MIVENLCYVMTLILIGSLLRKSKRFPISTAQVLNAFVLNIALPAIILISIPKLQISTQMIYPVAIHWVALCIHLILIFILCKIFNFSRGTLGTLVIVSSLGNTAFLGIPMNKTFFGEEAIPFAVLYDQLGSGIGFIIYGAFVLPLFTFAKKKKITEIILSLMKFPAFIALILGFILMLFPPLPSVVNNILIQLSATLIPCAMIAVGYSMKYRLPKTTLIPLSIGLFLKLLLLPFIVFFIVKGIGLSGVSINVSILQSGMPPMITAGAMAVAAKLEEELSVALVGFGLIFSFASLSLLKYFL